MPMKQPPAAATAAANDNQGAPPPRDLSPHRGEVLPAFKDQADSVSPSRQQPIPSAPVPQPWPPMRQHAGGNPSYAGLPSYKDQAQPVDPPADDAKPAPVANQSSNHPAARTQQQPLPPPQQQIETDASFVPLAQGIPVSLDHDLTTATQPPPPAETTMILKKHLLWGMVILGMTIVIAVAAVVGFLVSSNSSGSAPATVPPPTGSNPATPREQPVSTTVSPAPPPQMEDSSTQSPVQTSTPPPPPPPTTPQPTAPFPVATTDSPTMPPTTSPQQSVTESPITNPAPTAGDNTDPGIPAVEVAKLTASDGAAGDRFGWSVAINGDTLVIGAYLDDTENGSNSGSAYVSTRSGTVWTEQAKLTASDGALNDQFGSSVAINGDTIVIGAIFGDTENGSGSGSAYVYTLSGTVWTEQTKLTASDGAAFDQFGTSVAINGDTMVIGAWRDDTENGSDSGSAYVYTLSGTVWTEQAKLTASDGAASDNFGTSVAINGDTLVIGARYDDTENGIENSGSAYVYTRSGTVWTEQAKLTASDGAEGDQFGDSVAMDGDTIVIGAPESFKDNDSGGRAYVYTRSGTVWTEQAKLTASDGAAYDWFGMSVAINGDTLVIGARYGDTENGSNSGSAYVYTRSGTVWTEQAKLTASDGTGSDRFGSSVAMDGDTIVIGAYQDDTEMGENSGSAYIFE